MEESVAFAEECLALLDVSPSSSTDPVGFCRSLFMKRNFHRLIQFVESQSEPQALASQIQYWYCISLVKSGHHKEAEIYIRSLPTSTQSSPQIVYARGLCHLKELDFQAATSDFVEAFTMDPYFIEPLHKLLSRHLLSQTAFEDLLTLPKETAIEHIKAVHEFASLSWLYEVDGKVAFETSERLLKEDPSSPRTIIAYVSACLFLRKKNELFTIAQRLADTAPQSSISMFASGCHMVLIGKSEAARSLFWTALRASPSYAANWIGYALTHWFDGDPRAALNVILVAARIFPAMELLQIWAGRLYSDCGEMAMAMAHYRRCKMTGYVWNEIGCIMLKKGKIGDAVEAFTKAVESPDVCSVFKVNCATAMRRMGQYEKALELVTEVEEKESENVNAVMEMGLIYHLTMRIDEAIAKYEKVLRLAPDNTFIQAMLDDAVQRSVPAPVTEVSEDFDEFEVKFAEWISTSSK